MNERERNREQFPGLAEMIDAFRKLYGKDVKLVAGIEGGREIGKVDEALRESAREAGIL